MDNSSILISAAGYTVVSDQSRLTLSRKIFLEGKIDHETACEIITSARKDRKVADGGRNRRRERDAAAIVDYFWRCA